MKKVLQSIVLLLGVLLPTTAAAYDFEVDGIYYYINGNEATVTNGNSWEWEYGSYFGDVTIPETVTYDGTTYSVTSIFPGAFANCTELTSVSIPNSITSIGQSLFTNCSKLTSVRIPKSVIFIEGYPFAGCSSLSSVIVDSDNPKYDSRDNCNAIIETASNTLIGGCMVTVIPNTVTTIGNYAFQLCPGLTSVNIPNSVTTIGEMAFARCGSLTNVNIGNSVSNIGTWTFVNCSSLSSIIVDSGNPKYDSRNNCNAIIETASNTLIVGCMGTVIPGSVTSIDYSAFYGCSGLTSMDIPNSVTSIGNSAFFGCSGLTSINIPNSVTTIGDYAFQSCTSLTSVDIPNSITAISDGVFGWCSNLTSVNIPNSVTSIGVGAFYLSGLTSVNIPNSVTTIGNVAFIDCSDLTSVIIPNSVTHIGDGAFSYCTSLTDVTIPNSVTHIGDEAFSYCIGMTDVYSYITNLSKVTCGDMMFHAYGYGGDDSDVDYSGRMLHVPQGTAEAYQANTSWYPYFGQIVEDLTPDHQPGDVNCDGEVNIADINAVINQILSTNHTANGDVNGDGEVNIADVNAVIGIILGGAAPNPDNHEYVDLGLPSGTMWAACNVGATSPEEYGDYFAWGETEPKEVYNMSTYKWYESDENYSGFTKYSTNSDWGYNGFVDGKMELDPEDDAAYVNYPDGRMPSKDQIDELCNSCTWQWAQMNGVDGQLLTGPNGNTLFLPASGYKYDNTFNSEGRFGFYCSRTHMSTNSYYPWTLRVGSDGYYRLGFSRARGYTVRAVRISQD